MQNALQLSPNISHTDIEDEATYTKRKFIVNNFMNFPNKYNEFLNRFPNGNFFNNLNFLENYGIQITRYCLYCLVQKVLFFNKA